jgi:hypothetical protein
VAAGNKPLQICNSHPFSGAAGSVTWVWLCSPTRNAVTVLCHGSHTNQVKELSDGIAVNALRRRPSMDLLSVLRQPVPNQPATIDGASRPAKPVHEHKVCGQFVSRHALGLGDIHAEHLCSLWQCDDLLDKEASGADGKLARTPFARGNVAEHLPHLLLG